MISELSRAARFPQCIAFEGSRRIAEGSIDEVAALTKEAIDRGGLAPILIFDWITSRPLEIDFRGTKDEVVSRLLPRKDSAAPQEDATAPEKRGPGRPKLGVVPREVTLLPRHWEWLNSQPGGASVALRKLVEQAKRSSAGADRARQNRESIHRFMSDLAGDLPGFEEALRALYAGNWERFDELVQPWPADVRTHLHDLRAASDENDGSPAIRS